MKFNLMRNFTFNRGVLSSYYIAVLVNYFLLQLISTTFRQWTITVAGYFSDWFGQNWQTSGKLWIVLFLISFLIILILRHFIIEPLGFIVDSSEGLGWESFFFGMMVLGLHIYLLNQTFSYAMPIDWWMPEWLIRLLGGYRNTFLASVSAENYREEWAWIPWLWYLGPITLLYFRQKVVIK